MLSKVSSPNDAVLARLKLCLGMLDHHTRVAFDAVSLDLSDLGPVALFVVCASCYYLQVASCSSTRGPSEVFAQRRRANHSNDFLYL